MVWLFQMDVQKRVARRGTKQYTYSLPEAVRTSNPWGFYSDHSRSFWNWHNFCSGTKPGKGLWFRCWGNRSLLWRQEGKLKFKTLTHFGIPAPCSRDPVEYRRFTETATREICLYRMGDLKDHKHPKSKRHFYMRYNLAWNRYEMLPEGEEIGLYFGHYLRVPNKEPCALNMSSMIPQTFQLMEQFLNYQIRRGITIADKKFNPAIPIFRTALLCSTAKSFRRLLRFSSM